MSQKETLQRIKEIEEMFTEGNISPSVFTSLSNEYHSLCIKVENMSFRQRLNKTKPIDYGYKFLKQ